MMRALTIVLACLDMPVLLIHTHSLWEYARAYPFSSVTILQNASPSLAVASCWSRLYLFEDTSAPLPAPSTCVDGVIASYQTRHRCRWIQNIDSLRTHSLLWLMSLSLASRHVDACTVVACQRENRRTTDLQIPPQTLYIHRQWGNKRVSNISMSNATLDTHHRGAMRAYV